MHSWFGARIGPVCVSSCITLTLTLTSRTSNKKRNTWCVYGAYSPPQPCARSRLVGLEAACLHVHTLTGFWSYNLMPIKQRADQPHSEWPTKYFVSCGQLWKCLPHFPVQLPQLSNTHTSTDPVGRSVPLTHWRRSGECSNTTLLLNRKEAGRGAYVCL